MRGLAGLVFKVEARRFTYAIKGVSSVRSPSYKLIM